jgi:hypothetical protein
LIDATSNAGLAVFCPQAPPAAKTSMAAPVKTFLIRPDPLAALPAIEPESPDGDSGRNSVRHFGWWSKSNQDFRPE